jgi:stage III sporulation protein SpoIIIAA
MAQFIIEIPEEMKEEMEELPDLNWQLVVRRSLKRELEEVHELKRIISKSKLTEDDVKELSDKIDESLAERFRESLKL